MKEKKESDIVWPIRMKKNLKDRFKKHCDENGYSMSKRIRTMMEMDINKNKIDA
jgi:antitoxin component of RelBE/YafQ-DinJ toxin-antitoxin module